MSANFPKLLFPLVQQTISDIGDGKLVIPNAKASADPSNPNFEAQVQFALTLREGLYKGSVLCGGPYGINALGAVNFALDPTLAEEVSKQGSARSSQPLKSREEYYKRGREMFQTIYQHHTEPILTKIGNSSQDLVQGILVDTYGRVLSDTSVISLQFTELCLVATLVPLDVPPQLKSHVHGAKNVGVPMEQVKQLVSVAETITQWVRSQDKSSL
ncbi:hypothetical protein BGZ76_002991 [Entomortierella beljakovae]|nr:hypothetical protein BGZ76_002991 [Entomortierella beljakovae]